MPNLTEVRTLAFSLPAQEQLKLADDLQQHADPRQSWSDQDILAEADRRDRAMDAGEEGVPMENVMSRIRARYARPLQ